MNSYAAIGRRALLTAGTLLATPALAQRGPRPTLLATTGMVGDLVRGVAGEGFNVETLIGEGVDPHLFRPTRNDVARLLRADAVFYNGHRLEGRMTEVLERAAAQGRPILAVAETLPRERLRPNEDYPDAADPHVWMDPTLWAECAPAVAQTLNRLRPGEDFRRGVEAIRMRLSRLDAYAREVLAPIPAASRVLLTAHDAFAYFGARYELEVESIQGLSTEAEASLANIEAMVRLIVERRIPAVFAESSVPDRAVRALIEGAGARGQRLAMGGVLYSDSMGRPGTYTGTYEGMMDHNITTIARALGGNPPPRGLNNRL
ncbi:metal ABC transporter solute-binding protein, Zn/Mn family [Roseococcus thiosulfatophilus]|uniref:metal ABC transporter solute-binding protein, Zn/Mn family n=1 Tax=Roseococcus thiosulfatophilus TaxID=35813 RepID=UPI001A90651A|nr:zinc ABC transporter substrate-binding protein [Roseococcus thiosulfatophilus]